MFQSIVIMYGKIYFDVEDRSYMFLHMLQYFVP